MRCLFPRGLVRRTIIRVRLISRFSGFCPGGLFFFSLLDLASLCLFLCLTRSGLIPVTLSLFLAHANEKQFDRCHVFNVEFGGFFKYLTSY
jgi:hypothetical protein